MKNILSFLFFILLIKTNAQTNTFNYLGTLLINNNQPMTFSLELTEKNGSINGFSITNIETENETKSEVKGIYLKNSKTLKIYEKSIIYTKSKAPLNSFCYLTMNLNFTGKFNKKRLEGTFTGNFLDRTKCAEGKVILMTKEKIERKIEKIERKIEKIERKIKTKKSSSNIDNEISSILIDNQKKLELNWKNKKLKLLIWDANNEDGDRIKIKINEKEALYNYETTNKKKQFSWKLKKGENIISITALNNGTNPPNTSRIQLIDKEKKYEFQTQLNKGESATIKIIRK